MHGTDNRQRARYGDLSLLLVGDFVSTGDRAGMTVESIEVLFSDRPVRLPQAIAAGLANDWASPRVADTINALTAAGLTALPDGEIVNAAGHTIRILRVVGTELSLVSVDDTLWKLAVGGWR